MSVVVCRPRSVVLRKVLVCGTCQRRRRFVVSVYAWYGTTFTCCACGDSWTAEGRMQRPFQRGWRKEATARAKVLWDIATPAAEVGAAIHLLMVEAS